jgi:RES domain-containing protein
MICYRVVRRKYANLSGEGARLYGGRFNPPGVPAVYSSQSIALALLELLVHIDKAEVPVDYIVMAIRFSAQNVSRPRSAKLTGAPLRTPTDFEAAFYNRPILRVPSVIVPREFNYVLFPEAAGFQASIEWIERLDFDSRLLASVGR